MNRLSLGNSAAQTPANAQTRRVISMQPVLEICRHEGFDFWPIAEIEPRSFMALGGTLTSAEVGTAVMGLAIANGDLEAEAESRAEVLHGLLTFDSLFAPGGFRVIDSATGTTLLPGCCNGLEERQDWYDLLDGRDLVGFGHDPAPSARRRGEQVRLTVDTDQDDSPTIDLSIAELRTLVAGAERDIADFLVVATEWVARHLPEHAQPVSAALVRAMALP
jgi:hypothetical protein